MNLRKKSSSVLFDHAGRSPRFQSLVWIFVICLCDFIIIYNVMYAIDELYFSRFLLCIILTGAILIATFILLEFYKSKFFSGFPYINKKAKKSLTYMKRVICFWVSGKAIEICIGIYLLFTSKLNHDQFSHYLEGKSLLGYSLYVIYALSLIITELIPGRFVLEKRFLYIFKGEQSDTQVDADASLDFSEDSVEGYKKMGDHESETIMHTSVAKRVYFNDVATEKIHQDPKFRSVAFEQKSQIQQKQFIWAYLLWRVRKAKDQSKKIGDERCEHVSAQRNTD